MTRDAAILGFWFGSHELGDPVDTSLMSMWFGKPEGIDERIRNQFGVDHERACAGELAGWADQARSRMALILLLDQFSRHIHRGQPGAFAQDPQAQRLASEGIERGHDRELPPLMRVFFYLPFEHAEDLALQRQSVACYEALAKSVAADETQRFESFVDYAVRHRDIVQRFGRFPHRNDILGRVSTPEERVFLTQPGSSF